MRLGRTGDQVIDRSGERGVLFSELCTLTGLVGADRLDVLLDGYAEHGIGEMESQKSSRVPPRSELGTPVEIAREFGGTSEFRGAVDELQGWPFESS